MVRPTSYRHRELVEQGRGLKKALLLVVIDCDLELLAGRKFFIERVQVETASLRHDWM